jgi:hypothetical protein
MLSETRLIEVLQKLYMGDAQLHVASSNEGWNVELEDERSAAFAKRTFTPDDIADLPRWIETESAKSQAVQQPEAEPRPPVPYLRLVK